MDGVLVKYSRQAYEGENPKYLRKGEHYYRDLLPDAKMQQVCKRLHDDENNKVFILTSITNDSKLYAEHIGDKKLWLEKYCPFIDTDTQLITTISSKRDIINALYYPNKTTLQPNDILIDDFNRNLTEWRASGGTAIKYLNGINSPDSYNGLNINVESTADDIIKLLYSLNMKGLH